MKLHTAPLRHVELGPDDPLPGTGFPGPEDGIAPVCPVVVPEGAVEVDGPWPYPDEVGIPAGAAGDIGRTTGAGLATGAFTTFGVWVPVDAFRVAALAGLAFALPRAARALGFLAADLAADMRDVLLAAFRTGFFARAPAERLVREVVFFLREDAFAISLTPCVGSDMPLGTGRSDHPSN